jgi:copper(I)-binding protein
VKAILTASLLLLASCGRSGSPDIQILNAWARETVSGQHGTAAYVTLVNQGSGDDRLIGVSAAPPVTASLHETATINGVSSMRELSDGLDVPAGDRVALKPGGAHVMISGLTAPLHQGGSLKLTLRFQRSGDRAVDFEVASATGGTGH